MANRLYTKARQKFLEAGINLLTDTIKASLIDTGAYTPNFDTNEFFSIIPGAAVISTATITGKTTTDGVFNGDDSTFLSVPAISPTIEVVLIWKDTGVAATSPLIAYIDSATGLPVQPSGGNLTVVWDNGTDKIFRLN